MKTLISLLSTFALILGAASLDLHHLNTDILIPALGVAALFAIALADNPQSNRRALARDLARFRCPVIGFRSQHSLPLKLAA